MADTKKRLIIVSDGAVEPSHAGLDAARETLQRLLALADEQETLERATDTVRDR
jgi:hypothetical protein